MLIKLTGIKHPDIGSAAPPVYVDPTKVILITEAHHYQAKLGAAELKREAYDDLWTGIQRLNEMLNKEMPSEIDTSKEAKWAKEMHLLSHSLQEAYSAWGRAFRTEDHHPRTVCTEIQLSCGTALEHGVMLARVWVKEHPDGVAAAVAAALDVQHYKMRHG